MNSNILQDIIDNKRREIAALNAKGSNRLTELMSHIFLNPPETMKAAIK